MASFGARTANKPPALLKQLKEKDRSDEVRLQSAVYALRASFNTLDVTQRRLEKGVSNRSNGMIAQTLRESRVREADQVWLQMAHDLAELQDSTDESGEDEDITLRRPQGDKSMMSDDAALLKEWGDRPCRKPVHGRFDLADPDAEKLCRNISGLLDSCSPRIIKNKQRPSTAPTGRTHSKERALLYLDAQGQRCKPRHDGGTALESPSAEWRQKRGAQPNLQRADAGIVRKTAKTCGLAGKDAWQQQGKQEVLSRDARIEEHTLQQSASAPAVAQKPVPSPALTSRECAKRRPQWSKMWDRKAAGWQKGQLPVQQQKANAQAPGTNHSSEVAGNS